MASILNLTTGVVYLAGAVPSGTIQIGTASTDSTSCLFISNSTNSVGIRIKPTGIDAHQPMMVFQRGSDNVVTGMVDEAGTFRTKLSISVSGGFSTTLNADGSINTRASGVSGLSDMLDIVSDTTYGIVSKGSSVPGELYTGLDQNGNYTHNIGPTGIIKWGAGNTFVSMDTSLDRIGAGSLALGTGAAGSFAGALKLTTLNSVGVVQSFSATAIPAGEQQAQVLQSRPPPTSASSSGRTSPRSPQRKAPFISDPTVRRPMIGPISILTGPLGGPPSLR